MALHQPLLWRKAGWWKAEYNIASSGESGESNLLLPVGDLDQALTMIGLALPEPRVSGGVSVRSLILAAMHGPVADGAEAAAAEAE
ncbi:hypothetical protein KCW65_26260, partial [Mycobacterium tuberculosis]|nr:hypothetical protein [Mycobacterium tuberculosis]